MNVFWPIVIFFALLCAALYLLALRATPGKGWVKLCERLFWGVIVVYLLNLVLTPLGLPIAENPVSSLVTGCLGLPGALLMLAVQRLL